MKGMSAGVQIFGQRTLRDNTMIPNLFSVADGRCPFRQQSPSVKIPSVLVTQIGPAPVPPAKRTLEQQRIL